MSTKPHTLLYLCTFICLSLASLFVFITTTSLDDQTISEAQGYPPPITTPLPEGQNNNGYPGPESNNLQPAPTSPPIIFTASYTTVLPLLAIDNLPEKKGMVWTYYPLTNIDPWNPMGIGWFYNYSPSLQGLNIVHGQIEFIPFWHCNNFTPTQMLTRVPATYDGYFLWLNEPDTSPEFPGGCHTLHDPVLAAGFYIEMRQTYPYAKFIGPHTYHGSDPAHQNAVNWVIQWRQEVYDYPNSTRPGGIYGEYPDVAGYGIHPYHTDRNENIGYVEDFYNQMVSWGEGEKELWVTEFTYCNVQTLTQDIQYTVNALETRTYIDRYAYWQDRKMTPTPTPIPSLTPGFDDTFDDTSQPSVPLGWCIDSGRSITLFDPDTGWTTLTEAGEAYSEVGNP